MAAIWSARKATRTVFGYPCVSMQAGVSKQNASPAVRDALKPSAM